MDTKELQEKMVVFLDAVGRVIIGECLNKADSKSDIVKVKNPAIVHVEPKDGNIAIQFFPVFFKEFLGAKDEGIVFDYNRNSITIGEDAVLDFKLYAQYLQMFYGVQAKAPAGVAPATQGTEPPKTVKLFDD